MTFERCPTSHANHHRSELQGRGGVVKVEIEDTTIVSDDDDAPLVPPLIIDVQEETSRFMAARKTHWLTVKRQGGYDDK